MSQKYILKNETISQWLIKMTALFQIANMDFDLPFLPPSVHPPPNPRVQRPSGQQHPTQQWILPSLQNLHQNILLFKIHFLKNKLILFIHRTKTWKFFPKWNCTIWIFVFVCIVNKVLRSKLLLWKVWFTVSKEGENEESYGGCS